MKKEGILKTLTVRNFKPYKDTTVEFTPGINVVVGSTNHGKSALFSAIRWLATGKPRGNGVISWWGGPTRVVAEFTDGEVVEKARNKTTASFKVGDRVFKATDGANPVEVDAALGIDEDLSIQRQLDPVFMLSKTAGQAASVINSIVNLDLVTATQAEAARDSRTIKAQLDAKEAEKVDIDLKLAAAAEIEAAVKPILDSIKSAETKHRDSSALRDRLVACAASVHAAHSALAALPSVPSVASLPAALARAQGAERTLAALRATEIKYTEAFRTVTDLRTRVEATRHVSDLRNTMPHLIALRTSHAYLVKAVAVFDDARAERERLLATTRTCGVRFQFLQHAHTTLTSRRGDLSVLQNATDRIATGRELDVKFAAVLPLFDVIESARKQCSLACNQRNSLVQQLSTIAEEEHNIPIITSQLEKAQLEVDALVRENGRCRFCGSLIS